MLPVSVYAVRGDASADLTGLLAGPPRYATAAVGGFADASFTLRGDQRRGVPYLSLIRVMLGADVLYEGQVEDAEPSGSGDSLVTSVSCFGLRNLLNENSLRRIWSKRDLGWIEYPVGVGGLIENSATKGALTVITGQFDPTNLVHSGVRLTGQGIAVASAAGNAAIIQLPSGLSAVSLLFTIAIAGANTGLNLLEPNYGYSTGGAIGSWTGVTFLPGSPTTDQSFAIGGDTIALGVFNNNAGPLTPTGGDTFDFYNIRILGTSLAEDAAGGFYGGTILRDLIGLIPGLTAGVIEDGSDFTIQAIERGVRTAAQSVVDEVAGYYTREWSVWENGRFDWKTRQLDQPDWLTTTADFEQLNIKGTLDGIARTVYVLYTDAASNVETEASDAATAQRNPYVKQGRAKDILVNPGFPMTSNTATQLASRIATDTGQWVPVQGTVVLPTTKLIPRALGAASPAAMIRAGDNIAITDLPKSDLFSQGRDGETLFHVVGTDCDLAAGTVTLELEGQASRTDVILARLAAVTRVLTG